MRAIVLLPLIAAICTFALVRPKVGLLAYIWFALMRPDYLAYVFDRYPLSMAIAVATLIGSLPYISTRFYRVFVNPITITLLLLQIPFLSSVFDAPYRDIAWFQYSLYIRSFAILLLVPILFNTLEDLRNMLIVMGASIAFIGAKFGLGGILAGGAVYTLGYTGFMSDNNTLALALAMGIPLCWYAQRMVTKMWMKMAFLTLVATNVATVIMCLSRAAALALGVVLLKISAQSRKRILVFAGLTILVLPSFFLMQAQFTKRMSTLDSLQSDSSAMSRIEQMHLAITVWRAHPLFGVGFGGQNYIIVGGETLQGNFHVVHNSYLQMLADCGIFAFFLYTGLVFGLIYWLGKSARKVRRLYPGMEIYPYAIQMSLIAFAVASLFHPRAYFDFSYMLFLAAGLWYEVVKQLSAPEVMPPVWAANHFAPFGVVAATRR
jgi:probable O-glycosylation ligase (exosortase A-associated)